MKFAQTLSRDEMRNVKAGFVNPAVEDGECSVHCSDGTNVDTSDCDRSTASDACGGIGNVDECVGSTACV